MSQLSADSLASAGDVPPKTSPTSPSGAPQEPPPELPDQPAAEAVLTLGVPAMGDPGFHGKSHPKNGKKLTYPHETYRIIRKAP